MKIKDERTDLSELEILKLEQQLKDSTVELDRQQQIIKELSMCKTGITLRELKTIFGEAVTASEQQLHNQIESKTLELNLEPAEIDREIDRLVKIFESLESDFLKAFQRELTEPGEICLYLMVLEIMKGIDEKYFEERHCDPGCYKLFQLAIESFLDSYLSKLSQYSTGH